MRRFDCVGADRVVIRKVAEDVFAVTGKNPLLKTAMALHDAALKDDYFVKRRLYPKCAAPLWRWLTGQRGLLVRINLQLSRISSASLAS